MDRDQHIESVGAFVGAASAFCNLVVGDLSSSRPELLADVHQRLAVLYLEALRLPDVAAGDREVPSAPTALSWQDLHACWGAYLGDLRYYSDTFDPTQLETASAVVSDLADDIADVYGDIIDGLALWPAGDAQDRLAAIWQWRFSFWSHWGQHAGGALRYLFQLLSPWLGNRSPDHAT